MKTVNLVIHILNSCLIIQFYKAIFPQDKSRLTRNLVALMFSVHPIHTEAVCGVVGRTDLLACLVFLITSILYFNVFYTGSLFHSMKLILFIHFK